jgi:signal transduction histidine kinase
LKDPLSVILGFAEVLSEDHNQFPPEKLSEYLNIIVSISRKAVSIINGLLLLAEVQHLQQQAEALDMQTIVNETLDRLTWQIAEGHAEIALPDTWPQVLGYPQLVEEVWANYINNALKYGGPNPQITLGYDSASEHPQDEAYQRFWVHDSGPGIALQIRENLFEPFVRLADGRLRSSSHGLGLSIVRRIIEKLGGKVGVESPPSGGCCFWFTLPKVEEGS